MKVEDHYEVYDKAIALNKEQRNTERASYLDLYHYMWEFGTIHLGLGRLTCKTTYIDENSHVLYDIVISKYKHHCFHSRYFWIGTDYSRAFCGMLLSDNATIWVDDYSHFSNMERERLLEILYIIYRKRTQTIILMG